MRVTSAGTVRDVAPVSEMHVSSHQSAGQVATAPAAAAPALEQGESFDNAAIAECILLYDWSGNSILYGVLLVVTSALVIAWCVYCQPLNKLVHVLWIIVGILRRGLCPFQHLETMQHDASFQPLGVIRRLK